MSVRRISSGTDEAIRDAMKRWAAKEIKRWAAKEITGDQYCMIRDELLANDREHERVYGRCRSTSSSDVSVTVNVGDIPPAGTQGARLFAIIVVAIAIVGGLNLWYWVFAGLFVIGSIYLLIAWGEKRERLITAELRRRAELVARADEQHNWVCQGDERGVYGKNQELCPRCGRPWKHCWESPCE